MKKVVVAMSGGVDSSVAAYILKEQGFDVIGIHLRLFDDKKIKCCGSYESEIRFKKICDHLGIKGYVKDVRKIFKESVIKKFANSYIMGQTPNPCVECNRVIKFDYLLNLSIALGASYIATGHYALIEKNNNEFLLKRGKDKTKDQSYFLYCIKKEFLNKIIFPVGMFFKKDIKKIAQSKNIPLDITQESKDICFIPHGRYQLFLKENGYVQSEEGFIKDTSGKIIGKHSGYYNFTIGQRKKLGISSTKRLYVIDIKPNTNEIIVGDIKDAFKKKIIVKDLNLLSNVKDGIILNAQIRYKHTPSPGIIRFIDDKTVEFEFKEPQFAITPGQSCVFYDDDIVLGGGIIDRVIE